LSCRKLGTEKAGVVCNRVPVYLTRTRSPENPSFDRAS
jgi:hypothetical protein